MIKERKLYQVHILITKDVLYYVFKIYFKILILSFYLPLFLRILSLDAPHSFFSDLCIKDLSGKFIVRVRDRHVNIDHYNPIVIRVEL